MSTIRTSRVGEGFTRLLIALAAGLLIHCVGFPQEKADSVTEIQKKALRVYITCDYCDLDYIRKEITFVNYVRDRTEAGVHVLVTTQTTGGGGKEYTLTFIGQQNFLGSNDTLVFTTKKADAEEIIRKHLVRTLKVGLMRYVAKTPLADEISISHTVPTKSAEVVDKWNYWVFATRYSGYFYGTDPYKSMNSWGSLSANRITNDLKVNLSTSFSYSEQRVKYDFGNGVEEIFSCSRSKGIDGLVVWSLTDHWSAGASGSSNSSTYNNTLFAVSGAPAIEYDLFPYFESTRHQLRFLYRPKCRYVKYDEETIYDKTSEILFNEVLTITLDLKEPWGSTSIGIEGSHYFHDFNKFNLSVTTECSIRLFEGLSFDIWGFYSRPHDQLSLPKGGATEYEVLLQRRELETQYQYNGSIGLSYTFGSIYNNIVNPRFGD